MGLRRMLVFEAKKVFLLIRRLERAFNPGRFLEVPIKDCFTYGGFRYGRGEYNPYESYLIDLEQGCPVHEVRKRFVEFIRYYRPRNFGEALGVSDLSKEYPLWRFPWDSFRKKNFNLNSGWSSDIESSPDILTHFAYQGVPFYRIEGEFSWLEGALYRMRHYGYKPEEHGSYIAVRPLVAENGETRFLVENGNHRISALSALGHRSVFAYQPFFSHAVHEKQCRRWCAVRKGYFEVSDALKIFKAYFEGNRNWKTTEEPAMIEASPEWEDG